MIGMSSLDLLAYPLRHTGRTVVAVIDARKGELFYAFYRPVPGGVQRVLEPRCGTIDDLIAEVMARSDDVICVGDGALRHRDEIVAELRCEMAEQFLSRPSAAPLVQLAHARALREEWVNPWEIQPLYMRLPDAQINWSVRATGSTDNTGELPR
jgi:tRNA threonylcarbamoyladenosine biosynthesis protein TsaB